MAKKTTQQRGLLPAPVGSSTTRRGDEEETLPHRKGAALQLDEFNLFVGRAMTTFGIVGNLIEIGTTCMAFMIMFLSDPGPKDIGYWPKLGLSLFFALVFQSAMWALVVNLNDSWVSIMSSNPREAFVSKGEVSLHLVILMIFQFGGAAINGLCDAIFLSEICKNQIVISLGTAALLLSSILLWPLGWKLVRHSKQRIQLKTQMARQLAQQYMQQQQGGRVVSPVVAGSVAPYRGR